MMKYSPFITCALIATAITATSVHAADIDTATGQSAGIADQLQARIDNEMNLQLQVMLKQEHGESITIMARKRLIQEDQPLNKRLFAVKRLEAKHDFK